MKSELRPLRLLIAGGGTGGHVLPAIAVLEELRLRSIPHEVLWVGGRKGVERRLAGEHGIPFAEIPTGKLRRYFSWENFTDAGRIPIGAIRAGLIVRKFKPDVIFGTGGATSVPTLVFGHHFAPVLTHEQTAQLGMANRISARWSNVLAVSWEATANVARKSHNNVVMTGNPVRRSLLDGSAERGYQHFGLNSSLPVLYVTGGAQGASPVNQRIEAILPQLLAFTQVVHQVGPDAINGDLSRLKAVRDALPAELRDRYVIAEFFGSELRDLYAISNLVVARSGAGTVAELAVMGLPAVLIPLPGTGGDEQTRNANLLSQTNAALAIPQSEATPERLLVEIRTMLTDQERLATMSRAARAAGQPDAATRLLDELLRLANRT